MPQRPTTLKLLARHCPMAVQHYEDGTHYDRRIFAVGTAAHEFLYAMARGDDVDGVALALASAGRGGTDSEPPLNIDAIMAGKEIALDWYEHVEGFLGTSRAKFEIGLAADKDWNPVRYDDPSAVIRARLDVLDVMEVDEEEFSGVGLLPDDYKTAWPTDETELQTIQVKTQAVLSAISWKRIGLDAPPDFIRRQVTNLRTKQTFSEDLWLDAEGRAKLEEWKVDIMTAVRAADVLPRVASPGVNCLGCGYVTRCDEAQDFLQDDARGTIERLAVMEATVSTWRSAARAATKTTPVHVDGGWVGYKPKTIRKLRESAIAGVWNRWSKGEDPEAHTDTGSDGVARGLLKSMKLGVGSIEAAAKVIFSGRDRATVTARREWVDGLVEDHGSKTFGCWKGTP